MFSLVNTQSEKRGSCASPARNETKYGKRASSVNQHLDLTYYDSDLKVMFLQNMGLRTIAVGLQRHSIRFV